jgi:hypothetical protein
VYRSNERQSRQNRHVHIDKDTFKQIFRDHWDTFRACNAHYNNDYHDAVVNRMLDCGDTEKMGYVQYRCCHCGEGRKIAFSCKSAFCLSCAKVYTDRWVDFIGNRLLPGVVYRHIVLTVPECLRLWFYRNPALLSPLMRAGQDCLKDLFDTFKKTNLDIGSVIVVQTAGRPGKYNPHLHIIVTSGGIDPDGKWVRADYFPYPMLHRKWQYHLLRMLGQQVDDPAVRKDIDHCWKTYTKGFVANIQPGEVPAGGKGLARYLAKYLVSPPISVRRIESYDGETVKYWYRDHRTKKIEHITMPVLLFIGRMVQHILPKGFQRIRYYGLHSHRRYDEMRSKLPGILRSDTAPTSPTEYRVTPRKTFAQLFRLTFGADPLLCPKCRQPMELERMWHPKYGTLHDWFDAEFEEVDLENRERGTLAQGDGNRGPVECSERVVSLPLPFM